MSKNIYQPKVITKFPDSLKVHLFRALEADPQFSEAHFQLALMYQKEGDNKQAETHFQRAIELACNQTREFEKRGEKLLKKLQIQNANVLFLKAQEKRHYSARVNYQLSIFYIDQNNSVQAKHCLENSIELNPASSKAHRNLGILLFQQQNYDAARLHIEKALDLNYSDRLSHLNLGLILKQSKDYTDAELHLLTALDIDPGYIVCLLEMALLQLVMENQIKAKIFYQKAREISPDITHADLDKVLK